MATTVDIAIGGAVAIGTLIAGYAAMRQLGIGPSPEDIGAALGRTTVEGITGAASGAGNALEPAGIAATNTAADTIMGPRTTADIKKLIVSGVGPNTQLSRDASFYRPTPQPVKQPTRVTRHTYEIEAGTGRKSTRPTGTVGVDNTPPWWKRATNVSLGNFSPF